MYMLEGGGFQWPNSEELLAFSFMMGPFLVPALLIWHEEVKSLMLELLDSVLSLAACLVGKLRGRTRAPP